MKNSIGEYDRSRIKKYLSAPATLTVFFIAAVLIRLAFLRIFYDVGTDKSALLLSALNFVHGHGMSLDAVTAADLSQKIYTPFILWPPGYSFLLSPFLLLFPGQYFLATYMIDVVATLLFFFYLLKLLKMIGFPTHLIPLFLIFQATFLPDYILISYPTDFLALSLMLAGIYYLIKIHVTTGRLLLWTACMLCCFIASGMVRYQYFPVVSVLVAVMTIRGLIIKNMGLVRTGSLSLIVIMAVLGGLLWYQKSLSGQAYYLEQNENGFYPSNLLYLYPVIPGSFYNLNFYAVQLSALFHNDYRFWTNGFMAINWPFFLLLLWISVKWLLGRKNDRPHAATLFWLYMECSALAIIALLAFLSLTKNIHVVNNVRDWTYVNEGRYYALVFLALQILAWWWLFGEGRINPIAGTLLRGLLILAMVIEIPHGIYLVAKRLPHTPSFSRVPVVKDDLRIISHFVDSVQKRDPGRLVVAAAGYEKGLIYIAGWYGAAGLYTPHVLNETVLHASAPVAVLLGVHDWELPQYELLFSRREVKRLLKRGDLNFFSFNIDPV